MEDEGNGKFTITRWDGWQLEFKDGRIRKLITEDSRTLHWSYDSTNPNLVTEIKEIGKDAVLALAISNNPLEMAGSSTDRGAHALTVNGDQYVFKYANGTLQDIEFPDGRKTQWLFEDNNGGGTEKRLTLTQESGWWRSWVFLDENRQLKTDDVWNYSMTGGTPDEDGMVYNRPTMERTRIATNEKQKVEYEAANSIEIRTDALSNITKTFSYKATGRLYNKTYKIERKRTGESEFTTIWRGAYDSETGDLLYAYDADDNETAFAYERFAGVSEFQSPKKVTITDPLGRVTAIERDEDGNIIKLTSPAGVVRKFEWDSRHRLTRLKNAADENLLRLVYGDKDQITERYDALNNKTTFAYTIHLGSPLLTKVTTPLGHITELTRDSKGRITKIERPSTSEWDFTYVDDWSAVEKITDPLNNETDFLYDTRLNRIKITDALNQETETTYDDLDLPKKVTDALDQITQLEWNGNGDMTKLTDPRNKIYNMAWESADKRKELAWPDTVKQTTTFNSDGNITTYQPRGANATITNTWNAAQEISAQSWVNGTDSGTTTLTRNSAGQITGASTTAMTLTVSGSFAYNTQGQPSSVSQTAGGITRTASLTYDLNGAIETITYPAGFTVEYVCNADGQVTAIKKGTTTLASYAYDSAGRLSTRTLSNGVVTTYGYDGMDRVNQIIVANGTSILWAERYGYNAVGARVFTLTGTAGTVGDAYSWDATSQLIGVKYGATGAGSGYASATSPVSTATWIYDAAGNRQTAVTASGTTSYTVNAINQYTKIEGSAPSEPTYSSRGDLATNGDWEYTYDAYGNLIQAHNTTSNVLAKYWRDAFGHRAMKDVDGSKTVYYNLGTAQLESYDVNAATASSTIYEPGIDRPLAEVSDSGTVTFYHQDWLGSVVLLTNSSGAKVQAYLYDVWGKVSGFDASGAPVTTTAVLSRFLYTAREFDQETGLYHYRARAYSPGLGRFAQFDPIDFSGGDFNFLRYVSNDPVNLVDPNGESALTAILPFAGGAAAADGPFPVGDVIGGSLLAGAALWDLYNWMNQEPAEEDCPVVPPSDPSESPGEGWEWRGNGPPGSNEGAWVNPGTGETLHPDLDHGPPHGSHWDYNRPGGGKGWRVAPGGGRMTPK